jgi:hypothetical protein
LVFLNKAYPTRWVNRFTKLWSRPMHPPLFFVCNSKLFLVVLPRVIEASGPLFHFRFIFKICILLNNKVN